MLFPCNRISNKDRPRSTIRRKRILCPLDWDILKKRPLSPFLRHYPEAISTFRRPLRCKESTIRDSSSNSVGDKSYNLRVDSDYCSSWWISSSIRLVTCTTLFDGLIFASSASISFANSPSKPNLYSRHQIWAVPKFR